MQGNISLFLSSANFFHKYFSGTLPECQTVWIKIRADRRSGLIWVQTVGKDQQQTTKFAAGRQRVKYSLTFDVNHLSADNSHEILETIGFSKDQKILKNIFHCIKSWHFHILACAFSYQSHLNIPECYMTE